MERWRRNFLSVWPCLFAVSTGLMGVLPALPLYIEERFGMTGPGEVERWTAIVFGAAPLTAAIFGPFWGALGDRVGRKAMVLRAHLGIALALLMMPWAGDPVTLAGLRVFQGMFAGYIAPAMALVSADVPAERQGSVIARLQLALALGLALGPVIAAEVAATHGREMVFWVGSGLAAASALPVILFVNEDRTQLTGSSRTDTVAPQRIRDVLGNRVFLGVLVCIFLLRFGLHMVEPFTALWVRELGALSALAPDDDVLALDRTVAVAFTILAAGQLLMTTTWGRLADRFGPLRCLTVAALALAVVFVAIAASDQIAVYLGLRCVAALFMAGLMTLAYASVGRRVDPARKALAFALVQSGMQFGLSLGPMLGSRLVPEVGLRGVFRVAAVVVLAAAIGMIAVRRVSRPMASSDV